MYLPQGFACDDPRELHGLIERYAFGMLLVGEEINHLPFRLVHLQQQATLVAHVSRANPLWESFDGKRAATAVFQGPHAYISPSWYTSRDEVPTWNYAVVHAHGIPRVLDDPTRLRAILEDLVDVYERDNPDLWRVSELLPETYERLSQAIVAFEIPIERLEGKFKLSQNRKPEDRDGALRGLAAGGHSELVDLMKRFART